MNKIKSIKKRGIGVPFQEMGDQSSSLGAEEQSGMKQKSRFIIILILGLLSAIGPFSIDMYLPGFPQIAADLHSTVAHVSLSLSSFFIGISFGQLLYGP